MTATAIESGRPLAEPRRADLRLDSVLHALSDPIRLLIVGSLAAAEGQAQACGTMDLPVGKSTRSHHFRVLREAGLVRQRDEGRRRMTVLRREDVDARFPGLLESVLAAARPST